MKTLYEASNAIEAHMLVDLLKQEGLTAHIRGAHLQAAVGEMPAAGLVSCYVYCRMSTITEGIDHNGDGVIDEKSIQSASGSGLGHESDRNFDGKVDLIGQYSKHGGMESTESDENFDNPWRSDIPGVHQSHHREKDESGTLQAWQTDVYGGGHQQGWNAGHPAHL